MGQLKKASNFSKKPPAVISTGIFARWRVNFVWSITLCKNSECEKTSFVKKCFWNYFLSSFSAFKNMTFIVLKHQTIFIGWQWSIVCYIIRQFQIFISILKFKWVFPAQKCCMSDYVRKINRELAIFSQLRNFIRQFTNFSIWGSIICLRLGIPLAI